MVLDLLETDWVEINSVASGSGEASPDFLVPSFSPGGVGDVGFEDCVLAAEDLDGFGGDDGAYFREEDRIGWGTKGKRARSRGT